jgi:RimJ/RimL family protein N-acetyltransferase
VPILRPWRTEDVPALVEAYRDPLLRRWTRAALDDEADAERWVAAQEAGRAAGDRFGFAVLESDEGPPVGHVVLKVTGRESAEVGFWVTARARGRGVAPSALEALTSWAFTTRGLVRLELLHQVDNLASCRVARKCGYDVERVLPPAPPAYPAEGHLHVRHRAF